MKKLKKVLLGVMSVALSLCMVACGNNDQKKNQVIATVNGDKIYQSDYDALYDEYLNYFGGTDEAATYLSTQKELILDELISNEVLMQKAKELKISCSEEEINEAYDTIVLQYGEETVKQMLEFSNMTEETYKQMVKEQLILSKLQEIMIAGDIEVTDEMLQNYYNEHISEYTIEAGGVKVEGITDAKVQPLEEVKEQVTVAVKEQEEYNLYAACLKKWTDEAKIVIYKERIK